MRVWLTPFLRHPRLSPIRPNGVPLWSQHSGVSVDYPDLEDALPFAQPSTQVRIHDIQGTGLRSLRENQAVTNVPEIVYGSCCSQCMIPFGERTMLGL